MGCRVVGLGKFSPTGSTWKSLHMYVSNKLRLGGHGKGRCVVGAMSCRSFPVLDI